MKNRTEKNVLRSSCGIFAAALLLVVAGTTTTWAGFHTIAGTDCSAYNNNQANKLERSHVRLLNPASNTQSLWVICSPPRAAAEVGTGNVIVAPVGFFDTGVTADITCIWREFDYTSIHVPGGNPDTINTINAVVGTIVNPGSTPATNFVNISPTTPSAVYSNYYTVACLLPPGTGINQILVNLN